MNDIFSFFSEQTTLMQVFWGTAIVSTAIMLIQTILSLLGMSDLDLDVGVDGGLDDCSGVDLFSVKNIVNFFVGFGWAGISFRPYVESDLLLIFLSLLVGVGFVLIFIFIFKQLMKLESNSAVGADACVGRTADVYLRIPASRSGKGKIQLSINGAAREFDAVTDDAELIPSGAVVTVLEVVGKSTLLVKRN